MTQKINKFWQRFLEKNNLPQSTTFTESFYFEFTEKPANKLLKLVKENKKVATTSLLIKNEEIAKQGDFSIVTTFKGTPKAVIQTQKVLVMPFKEMTFEIAKLEGEDECLDTWIKNHVAFFKEEGEEKGYSFTYDMPIFSEEFELVYK